MTLAAIAIVLPAAYYHSQYPVHKAFINRGDLVPAGTAENTQHGLEVISHGTAILLLVIYVAYLFFEVCNFSIFHYYSDGNTAQNPCICIQRCEWRNGR